MKKNKTIIQFIVLGIVAVLLIGTALGLVRYNSKKVNETIYKSSTANLSEVYTQVKNNFVLTTQEQWKMLSLAGEYIEEASKSNTNIEGYISKWNEDRKFTEFYFLNSEGNYYTVNGTKGMVDLGSAWKKLFRNGQNIVIDGSIPGKEAMMFFAVPVQAGTYNGFSYSAIAIAYNKSSLNKELGVSAFDGQSSCYIVNTKGKIILQNEEATDLGGNILYHMKNSSLGAEQLEALGESFKNYESGTLKYTCTDCNRENYYLFYTAIEIEDWILVATVPSTMVDEPSGTIQKSIMIMLTAVFSAFVIIIIAIVIWINRRTINEKNQKIWQQNILFMQMSEHMNDIFVLYNTNTKHVEYISNNVERVLGISQSEAETQMGGITTAFQIPEKLGQMKSAIDELSPGSSLEGVEVFTNAKTNEKYIFHVSAIRESESAELVSIIFSDRTKEQEARKQIEDALMVAEHANRAKTTFLNNMSHDIRTPMNAIIGFTSLAVAHIDQTELVKDYLHKIMVSGDHLLSLINDVLDMSRIESGKMKIEEKETSLPVIMHDLRNILQTDIKAKRLEFYIDTVDIVHEGIICDKLRLNQILINLMSNAMKFTEAGGTVGIRVIEKKGAPEGYADYEFRVKDTGIGMSEEFAAQIFEPFTREENSTVSQIQGTGLGMAITKNIVDMMNGHIAVKTKRGEGSEFIVNLRFKTTETKQEIKVIKRLEGFRALVADDSMDSCSCVTSMLRQIGMRPEWTTSGKEAVYRSSLAVKEGDPFHAYIIDWLMPDMNGVEVVRRIRQEIGNQTPIIILTAYDWSSIEKEAREAGVTAFCAKPLFMSELYSILQNEGSIPEAEVVDNFSAEQFKGKRVLLVDDVELNREIAEAVLAEAGITVETAEDGQEALQIIEKSNGRFDLVLMDVMMPVMNGYEATRAIRQLDNEQLASIPIIAMTANAFEEDKLEAIEAGMNDHLAKPFQIEKLYEMMKKYL